MRLAQANVMMLTEASVTKGEDFYRKCYFELLAFIFPIFKILNLCFPF